MYEIEKGVPLDNSRGNGGRAKYPWRKMAVGDSFVMDQRIQTASANASSAQKATGFKFSCRTISETETRIWRVA